MGIAKRAFRSLGLAGALLADGCRLAPPTYLSGMREADIPSVARNAHAKPVLGRDYSKMVPEEVIKAIRFPEEAQDYLLSTSKTCREVSLERGPFRRLIRQGKAIAANGR
jgi:hypothetical protein